MFLTAKHAGVLIRLHDPEYNGIINYGGEKREETFNSPMKTN